MKELTKYELDQLEEAINKQVEELGWNRYD